LPSEEVHAADGRWSYPCVIALFVAATHFVLRLHAPNYVFDDTPHVYDAFIASNGHVASLGLSDLWNIIRQQFTEQSPREYRPLSFIQNELILSHYGPHYAVRPIIPIIVVSSGWGILAGLHFVLARRILGRPNWAIFATFIYITTMPVITGSWIVAMGWQWVVSLSVIAGLLCYQNYKSRPHGIWLAMIVLITVIGCWFREYSGLFVFIALVNELLFERNRSPALLATLLLSAFHVIFPAFLANILFFGGVSNIALTPVWRLGPIGLLSDKGETLLQLSSLRWDALYHFVLLVPPLLWLLGAAGVIVGRWPCERLFVLSERITSSLTRVLAALYASRVFGLLFAVANLVAARGIVHVSYHAFDVAGVAAVFLFAVAYVVPISSLLALYGVLSFLPFLKIYLHEVHLAYSAAPFAIILARMVMPLWDHVRERASVLNTRVTTALVGLVLAVVATDNALNVVASFRAINAVYRGAEERGRWLREHVPEGSIVVGNFLDLRDTLLYAPRHFEPYFSVPAAWEPNHVETGAKLLAMLDAELPRREVYLLGSVFPRYPGKYWYHDLHYLAPVQDTSPVRHVFGTHAVYPYADPLKYFVPDALTSYPGPPDLVDDYHVGPERTGSPFARELYSDYLLLKVAPLSEQQREAILHSKDDLGMIEAYRGFNLFRVQQDTIGQDLTGRPIIEGSFVALDQSAGWVNVGDLAHDRHYQACAARGRCFTAPSVEALRRGIDQIGVRP
jgi:hypothetical protein